MLNIKKTLIALYSFAKVVDVIAIVYSENKEKIDTAIVALVDSCRVLLGKKALIENKN